MSSSDKILFLLSGFPSGENDENCLPFVQDVMIEMIKKLKPENIRVISTQYPFVRKEYLWHGVRVYAIGGANRSGLYKCVTWTRTLMKLVQLHKKEKINIIHAFWLHECALISQLFSFIYPVKIVVTVPGQDAKSSNRYLPFLNFRKIHVSGLSEFVISELKKHRNLSRYGVISHGIIINSSRPDHSNSEGYDILGVGNINPLKNYGLFVSVIYALFLKNKNIKAAIIGDGKELIKLKKRSEELGLAGNLTFLGELKRSMVLDVMSNSKVFLHTSNYEGQGIVFSEALSKGMQVVSTRVADNHKINEISVGDNAEELANITEEKLLNFNRRKIILKDASTSSEEYIQLYTSLHC